MEKIEKIFYENIRKITEEGYNTEKFPELAGVRPVYRDGETAHYHAIHQISEEYNIANGEFPLTCLAPVRWKEAIGEMLWIYQDQSNDVDLLRDKYGVSWWKYWADQQGTIGQCYGATVKRYDLTNRLLDGLKNTPLGRSHIIDLYQYQDLSEPHALDPCAYGTLWSVRPDDSGEIFLDTTLTQRSSDYLMAGFINKIQYTAFMMMVARDCGYEPGNFVHLAQNVHIYNRHLDAADEIKKRYDYSLAFYRKLKRDHVLDSDSTLQALFPHDQTIMFQQPKLVLNPNKKNFYDIGLEDFWVEDYDPLPAIRTLDIAI